MAANMAEIWHSDDHNSSSMAGWDLILVSSLWFSSSRNVKFIFNEFNFKFISNLNVKQFARWRHCFVLRAFPAPYSQQYFMGLGALNTHTHTHTHTHTYTHTHIHTHTHTHTHTQTHTHTYTHTCTRAVGYVYLNWHRFLTVDLINNFKYFFNIGRNVFGRLRLVKTMIILADLFTVHVKTGGE